MTSRERIAQARHVMLLSNDAPVSNRCAREEAHLKDSLAQTTAACALLTQRSRAAAEDEERSRESRLQAQLRALLSDTPDIMVPSFTTRELANAAERDRNSAAAANGRSKSRLKISSSTAVAQRSDSKLGSCVTAGGSAMPAASPPCALGFPEAYESSGFRSTIHWASVAYDETFLTAYGPRRCRKEAQVEAIAGAGGAAAAREAQPHRLMTAVACYLLNEVLCADAAVSELWREKLRQPIFDAIFSSRSIAMGQERSRAQRCDGVDGAAIADVIVQRTIGPTSSLPSGAAADYWAVASFPPRTNTYNTRDDFASLRLWIEEVAVEQREKATVCQRVRSLQHATVRRQMADQLFQRRAHQAELQAVFTVWRAHTRHCRANRSAMERYLVKRHHRHVEETVFLRWRRFTLRSKVEALQRLVLSIAASRDGAAREHAASLRELQDRLTSERRQHLEETFERNTLQTQMLDSHAMEIDALQLMLKMEKLQTTESDKWAMRWERVAKTFRPAKPCPAVPGPLWTMARALLSSEEALAAMVLMRNGDQQVSSQSPATLILQARQQMEQLLLMWVNLIMEESPQASAWVPVDTFTYGHRAHPQGISLSQKQSSSKKPAAPRSGKGAGTGDSTCVFNIYTLMSLVRELRRRYAKAGLMEVEDLCPSDGSSVSGLSTLTECYQELAHLIVVQTCGGLYPPLLVHCPSFSLWFTPEGVFSGPLSHLEGPTRQRRRQQQQEQHTTFLWLLASLFVGHIQMMWMPPFGDRVALPIQPPAEETKTLQCKHEAGMIKLAQISFPMRHIVPPAGSAAAPGGSSVVAQNTLLPKKRSPARPKASLSKRAATNASGAAKNAAGGAAVSSGITLEAALRARCKETRGSASSSGSSALSGKDLLTVADESLSDIEAFLGMEPEPVQLLKEVTGANGSEGEDDEDRWVDGLLHQLLKAEDAEVQLRRTMRLQGGEVLKDSAEDGHAPPVVAPPASAFVDEEEGGCERQNHDNAAAVNAAGPIHGGFSKAAAILTIEQLRLLRSLPGRSCGFDTLRPIAVAPSKAAAEGREPSTTSSSAASHASSASLFSFLLNTLDDTVARQQWHGLVRIVTSLLVRFHVLYDSEDATRRAAVLATAKEGYEECKSAGASYPSPVLSSGRATPSSASRLPPVSVGCAPTTATKHNPCDGVAGVANPTYGGRIPAHLVSATLSQPTQPPPSQLDEKAQQCLVRTHGPPRTNIASNSGAMSSLHGVEHAVSVSSVQALLATATSVMLVEELRRRRAYQMSSAQVSVSDSSPEGYSGEGVPSFEPSRFADPPNSTEASTTMAPLSSAEVHTPVIPTAALLPADRDGYGVEQHGTESAESISGITPKDRSTFRSTVTGNAGTRAVTTKVRTHNAAEVVAIEQGAEHVPPLAPAPESSARMCGTAQQSSEGIGGEHPGTWVHGNDVFSEAHARAFTRPPSQPPPISAHAGQSTARAPTTRSVCPGETEQVLSLRPASSFSETCSSSFSAPSSSVNNTCSNAPGNYILPKAVTAKIPLPPTLPTPAPPPPPQSAPALEYSPDPVTAPAEPKNPLSPLIVHATHPPQSEGQKRRRDYFQMKP